MSCCNEERRNQRKLISPEMSGEHPPVKKVFVVILDQARTENFFRVIKGAQEITTVLSDAPLTLQCSDAGGHRHVLFQVEQVTPNDERIVAMNSKPKPSPIVDVMFWDKMLPPHHPPTDSRHRIGTWEFTLDFGEEEACLEGWASAVQIYRSTPGESAGSP